MAANSLSAIGGTYNTFSGVDIKAVLGGSVIGEIQGISYSISREKAPIWTLGSAEPRSFSRGKRGIAGSLIFIVFDRNALVAGMAGNKFLSDIDDIRPTFASTASATSDPLATSITDTVGTGAGDTGLGLTGLGNQQESNLGDTNATIGGDQEWADPWYADQIPPFDITLAAANESGHLSVMRIYGVEILNEGYGISIDDVVSEQQFSYVARSLMGWQSLGSSNPPGATPVV